MIKKNLKSLKLNKKSISNLGSTTIIGGGMTLGGTPCPKLPPIHNPFPSSVDTTDPEPIFSIVEIC